MFKLIPKFTPKIIDIGFYTIKILLINKSQHISQQKEQIKNQLKEQTGKCLKIYVNVWICL